MQWKKQAVMNRILLDNNQIKYECDDSVIVTNCKNAINIKIFKDTILNIWIKESNINIEINVENSVKLKANILSKNDSNQVIYNISENAQVITNKLATDNNDNIIINLNGYQASVIYNYSTVNYKESFYKIDVKHNVNKTVSHIYNYGLSETDKKMTFSINGYVYKTSSQCTCNQDNKIIYMKENKSVIEPNLFIENYDVEANHAAYIGKFKEKDLFYLMSRGIKKEDCYKLFIKSFILGKMILEKDERDLFEKELKNLF